MRLQDIITERITKAAGGTSDDLESPPVPTGCILEITHVSIENKTTAYTRLTVGRVDGNQFDEIEEEDSPSAADIFWTRSRILIPAGGRLRARLTGCTAADVLIMNYEGKLYRQD